MTGALLHLSRDRGGIWVGSLRPAVIFGVCTLVLQKLVCCASCPSMGGRGVVGSRPKQMCSRAINQDQCSTPQPLLILLSEPGAERKVLAKET